MAKGTGIKRSQAVAGAVRMGGTNGNGRSGRPQLDAPSSMKGMGSAPAPLGKKKAMPKPAGPIAPSPKAAKMVGTQMPSPMPMAPKKASKKGYSSY